MRPRGTNIIPLPKWMTEAEVKDLMAWFDGLTLEELKQLKEYYESQEQAE